MRSILNKLTPQKFQTLVSKMVELKIDNQTKLESAIELIFEKAISEPGFSVAYANMCRVLTDAVSNVLFALLKCCFFEILKVFKF